MIATNRRLMCVALCASAAVSAAAQTKTHTETTTHASHKIHLEKAYYAGDLVKLGVTPLERGEHYVIVGPWNLGPHVATRPSDKRPNLYFVFPGLQYQVAEYPAYSTTEILSAAPDEPKEFDIYWSVVLDPTLKEDFVSEKQLLLATQQTFDPPADFNFSDIPSAGFLRDFLKINSLDGLDKYRRAGGALPRMAIITAHKTVRISVEKPEEQQAEQATAH